MPNCKRVAPGLIFANYNPDFEHQARTLGANKFKTFYLITLPSIAPGLVVAS